MLSPSGGQGFISLAGEGKSFQALGATWVFKSLGEQTGGTLETFELFFPPSVQLPTHVHRQFDEAIYVLEGELTVRVGDRTVTMRAGSFAFVPRGTVHRVENGGTSPAKILLWEAPAPSIDKLLEEMNQLPPGPTDMGKLLPVLLKYDIELVGGS
ncbi:MAG: cupin domain-containing protein [Armatimonadetes bacterium]|nr:cupin domain-containing protein [Armatimonadota bacterium]